MHFWRPTPACNTYLGERFDQVSEKSISLFYFLQWDATKIFATLAILYFFSAKKNTKTDKKKYNMAKAVNILVYYHCKK